MACITDTSLVVAALGLDIVLARQLDGRILDPVGSSTVVCSLHEHPTKTIFQNCRENRLAGISGKVTRMRVQDRDRSMSGRQTAEIMFGGLRVSLSPRDQLATRRRPLRFRVGRQELSVCEAGCRWISKAHSTAH
jgi:hypothetical protein